MVTVKSLEYVHRLRYFLFCNVLHIYGQSGPSLLIESTDSMIDLVACITLFTCHCSSFVVFTINDNFF